MFRSKDITQYIQAKAENKNNFVLEIGANNGSDTVVFDALLEGYQIIAFEPDDRAFAKLNNNKFKSTSCLQMAISDVDGVLPFHKSTSAQDWDMSGSLLEPHNHKKYHAWVQFNEIINVQSYRLDTFFKGKVLNEISFIWMDTQGAEKKVLLGMGELLKKTRYIWTEYNNAELYKGQPKQTELLGLLKDFEMIIDDGDNILMKNKYL